MVLISPNRSACIDSSIVTIKYLIKSPKTHINRKQTTNISGNYKVEDLRPWNYLLFEDCEEEWQWIIVKNN